MIWFLYSKLDLNLSCAKDFRNLNSMVTWWIVGSYIFSAQFIEIISNYKILAVTLMYCKRLHAWWSTQSRLATSLSSSIARWWVGLQTLWRFRLKRLIYWWDGRGLMLWLLSGPPGFTCWISFAPVFSFIYCWVLIFALYPYISWFICYRRRCIDKLGVFYANQASICLVWNLN